MLPNAQESAPPVMGEMPEDSQEGTLEFHLSSALAIITRDGMLSPQEMQLVSGFMQGIQMAAAARQGMGQPNYLASMAQQGAQPPGVEQGEPEPYMSHVGEPKTNGFGGNT